MSLLFDERNDLANLCKYLRKCELLYTVFPLKQLFFFWALGATTIQGRQLFKGGNYCFFLIFGSVLKSRIVVALADI